MNIHKDIRLIPEFDPLTPNCLWAYGSHHYEYGLASSFTFKFEDLLPFDYDSKMWQEIGSLLILVFHYWTKQNEIVCPFTLGKEFNKDIHATYVSSKQQLEESSLSLWVEICFLSFICKLGYKFVCSNLWGLLEYGCFFLYWFDLVFLL